MPGKVAVGIKTADVDTGAKAIEASGGAIREQAARKCAGQVVIELPTVGADLMRDVMGTFCTGVVVVTAAGDQPLGFTCQSFASLSLDPPLVTFAPARTSTTWPQVRELGTFCVNVLAHDQAGLSRQFAVSGGDKFAGVEWRPSPLGSPLIAGVSAWVDCELKEELDGGDHTIALGVVRALGMEPGLHPLIFYHGRYAPSAHWEVWESVTVQGTGRRAGSNGER